MPKLTIDRLKKCHCGKPAVTEDLKCVEHTNCVIHRSPNNPSKFKNPMGVELEFYVNRNHANIQHYARAVGGDGSLGTIINKYGVEFRFCHEAAKVGQKAGYVMKGLKEEGASPFVNEKCGFHVHLSLGGVPDANDGRLKHSRLERIAPLEEEIYKLFPERKESQTCYSAPLSNYSRYCWITGFSHYPTVECRLHSGTTNPDIIITWVKACHVLQKLVQSVLKEEDTKLTRLAKKGKFIQLFNPGTVARKYLDYRKREIENNTNPYELMDNFSLQSS